MQTYALFGAKKSFFSNFMVCLHRQGGQFFAILCGRLLWTTPNNNDKDWVINKLRAFSLPFHC